PISKGLWRTTLEPATHPHLCTSRLLLLAEFGDGVCQRWGFFIPAIWVCGQNPGPKRRMSVYSREERMKAVKLYFQYERQVAAVLRELGYPSRDALRRWVAELEATGDVHAVFVTVLLHKLVCQLAPGRLRRLASSHELWPAGVVHAPRSGLLASRLAPSDRSSTDKRASISLATR